METFIVRVWVPPESSTREPTLCGVVEHLSSGTETTFVDEDELLAALRSKKRQREAASHVGGTP